MSLTSEVTVTPDPASSLTVVGELSPASDNPLVAIFYSTTLSNDLARIQSLAACLGTNAKLIDIHSRDSLLCALNETAATGTKAVILDIQSLKESCDLVEANEVREFLSRYEVPVLLLALQANQSCDQFLKILTDGHVRGIESLSFANSVRFPEASKLSKELASQSYPRKERAAIGLALDCDKGIEVIMTLQQTPSFVRIVMGKATIFVWSTIEVFDMYRKLAVELEFEEAVEEYVPLIIFLRFSLGDRCWHNPTPSAGFVIDDPLLEKKYGFINFPQLLESARRTGYHITLAFIPWNYRRNRSRNAEMFRAYSDCFHLCAHGCDHTNRELRSGDYEELLSKSFIARRRMEQLRDRTGIPTDPIMVCPQEQYSLAAMRAFADSRQFIGLACTACIPQDIESPRITGADLLLPAQDCFYGFPVFKRHYAGDISVFAMSLFLGKPAILVEHHGFFRDGIGRLEEFVRRLSAITGDLKWQSLSGAVTGAHIRRRVDRGKWQVRFFSDTFHLQHAAQEYMEYRLIRRTPDASRLKCVRVNGKEVPFTLSDGFIEIDFAVSHPRIISVQLEFTIVKPKKVYSPGLKYQASVAVRRGLSEFRDSVIARNRVIHRSCNRLMKVLGRTGG